MEVKLLRHTPEPEKTVAMSARLCYSPVGAALLEEKMSDEQAAKLVRKLVEMAVSYTHLTLPTILLV